MPKDRTKEEWVIKRLDDIQPDWRDGIITKRTKQKITDELNKAYEGLFLNVTIDFSAIETYARKHTK